MNAQYTEFARGMRDTLPMVVGAIPFGILFGALSVTSGLSVWASLAMSLLVFAGSAQFIAASLFASGATVWVIVLTTFVVNARHVLYAASLGSYLRALPLRWLIPIAHWITDETYAVVIRRYDDQMEVRHRRWYYAGSGAFMYANWQICTVVGIIAGQNLSNVRSWGLEFAMVLTFIGIVVPMLRNRPQLVCAAVSGLVALVAYDLPSNTGLLLAAVCGVTCGYAMEVLAYCKNTAEAGKTQ